MGLLKKTIGEEDFSRDLLRGFDQDGAEYYTVKATGESGMSHRGLARFVGLSQANISYLVSRVRNADLTNNNLPEYLKAFVGKPLTLTNYRNGRPDILEDIFCAAVVKYFAQDYKPRTRNGNHKAKQALTLIEQLGMRLYIHRRTGWQSSSTASKSDNFEQEFDAHKGRYSVRQILRFEDDPELKSAINKYRRDHRRSLKIFSDTYDMMNKLLQGVTSRQIKQQNNLSKSALIRDYYDTRPLMDYSTVTRLTTNQIRQGVDPVEAVKYVFNLLYPEYVPQPIPLIENVYKADKKLKAEARRRKLSAGIQLSLLPPFNPQISEV